MTLTSTLALSASLVVAGTAASAATLGVDASAFALAKDGTALVTLATPNDESPVAVDLTFANGSVVTLDAIAYRPETDGMYGYDNENGTVYEIDRVSGASTAIAGGGLTSSDDIGFDFNNVLDAARIVSANEENRVFRPNAVPADIVGEVNGVMNLFYVDGDVNAQADPNVVMNAYTNAVSSPSATQQYVIDTNLNILATLGNNAGTLSTLGNLYLNGAAFDVSSVGGFDILSFAEGDNTAYALLTHTAGGQAVYEVPLMADSRGNVVLSKLFDATTVYGALDGFAVAPVAAVPVPAAGLMLLTGLGAAAAVRRKKA